MIKTIITAVCTISVFVWADIAKADISRLPPDVAKGIAALGPAKQAS